MEGNIEGRTSKSPKPLAKYVQKKYVIGEKYRKLPGSDKKLFQLAIIFYI
jgi:hypothetical protein